MLRAPKPSNNEGTTEQDTEEFSPVKTRSSRVKEMKQTQGNNLSKVTEIGRKNNEEHHINSSDENEHLSNSEAQSVAQSKVSRKSKSHCSTTSSKRKLIEARKAAKRAQIKLDAMKLEAEFRAKEVQLESERMIRQQQLEVDLANAELIEEQCISGSEDNSTK